MMDTALTHSRSFAYRHVSTRFRIYGDGGGARYGGGGALYGGGGALYGGGGARYGGDGPPL